jgi:ABC-2 type transport system permease protein
MLRTIFTYEWIALWRSKGMMVALIAFTAIGIFCIKQGKTIYHYQRTTVDSALAKKNSNYQKVKSIFDTLTYTGTTRNNIEEPFVLEWRLQEVVIKNISPLSALSIGQSDVYAPLLSGNFSNDIFRTTYTEFKNPEQLLVGNLDTAFFMVFLFPLLLLALTYNLQSADKEAGIYPLLQAQSAAITKVMLTRLLFRWLVAMLPVIVLAIVSLLLLANLPNFSATAFATWWLVALLYTLFWLLVVAVVLRFQYSSLVNAIVLAGTWVLLLIAIPGLLNTVFNYKYPATNKIEVTEFRDFDYKTWDLPMAVHKKYLFSKYPTAEKDTARLDSNNIRSFSYSLQVINKEKELHHSIIKQANQQALAEEKTFWINPVGGIMRSFASISQTSLHQQHQFEKDVLAYREKKLKYIFENVLMQPHFTKKDFETMPAIPITTLQKSMLSFLWPLLLLMLIASVMVVVKFPSKQSK